MVDMVPRQYNHLRKCTCSAVQRSPGNIIFASCRRRSCANRFLVGLADVSQLCQQNLPYLCRVQSALVHYLYTVVKPIVSAINNRKTMGGGHAVHERQAILSNPTMYREAGTRLQIY